MKKQIAVTNKNPDWVICLQDRDYFACVSFVTVFWFDGGRILKPLIGTKEQCFGVEFGELFFSMWPSL
jgi:hypothetical protein